MTLQSHPNVEEVGPSPSCSTSTSSTDVSPYPYSVGEKTIVLNNEEQTLVGVVTENEFLGTNPNIWVESSTHVDIGNRTFFHGDVTIYQNFPNNVPEVPSGPIEHAVNCTKTGQVVESSPSTPQMKCLNDIKGFFKQRPAQLGIAAILLVFIIMSSITIYFALDFSFNTPHPIHEPIGGHNDDLGDGIQIMGRKEWLARDPLNTTKITHPLKMVRILHTGGSYCKDYQECANMVLALQGWQVGTQGMPDIAFNYIIGGDGNVYVGRGPDVENEWSTSAIDIVYMGNFLTPYDKMTEKMEEAGMRLIARLRETNKITPEYIIVAHNQTYNTQSPGQNIYKKMVKWAHYDPGLYFD